jgi:hypothetical protein
MTVLLLSLLVALVGAFLYLALSGGPGLKDKVAVLGLVAFGAGLLVTLENVTGHASIEAHAKEIRK